MSVIRKIRSLAAILAVVWAFAPLSARADTTWNTTVTPTTTFSGTQMPQGLVSGNCTNNIPAVGCTSYGNQVQFLSGSTPLFATAYFVNTNAPSDTLQQAHLQVYTGTGFGIGVTSKTVSPAVNYGGSLDFNPQIGSSFTDINSTAPGHTVDNQGVYDMVVFQLPSSYFDVTQIVLNTFSTTAYASGAADFSIFVGGNSSASNLSLGGFTGVTLAQLTGTYGFTEIDYLGSMFTNNCSFTPTKTWSCNVNSNNLAGKYLIVAASLTNTNRNDDFKIASIVGHTLTKVAEPSSISLLFMGGIMVLYFRRRVAVRC